MNYVKRLLTHCHLNPCPTKTNSIVVTGLDRQVTPLIQPFNAHHDRKRPVNFDEIFQPKANWCTGRRRKDIHKTNNSSNTLCDHTEFLRYI